MLSLHIPQYHPIPKAWLNGENFTDSLNVRGIKYHIFKMCFAHPSLLSSVSH